MVIFGEDTRAGASTFWFSVRLAVMSCGQLSHRLYARGNEPEALQRGPDAASALQKVTGHRHNNDVRACEIVDKGNA